MGRGSCQPSGNGTDDFSRSAQMCGKGPSQRSAIVCVPRVMGSVHCSSHLADDVFQLPVTPLNPVWTCLLVQADLDRARLRGGVQGRQRVVGGDGELDLVLRPVRQLARVPDAGRPVGIRLAREAHPDVAAVEVPRLDRELRVSRCQPRSAVPRTVPSGTGKAPGMLTRLRFIGLMIVSSKVNSRIQELQRLPPRRPDIPLHLLPHTGGAAAIIHLYHETIRLASFDRLRAHVNGEWLVSHPFKGLGSPRPRGRCRAGA